MHFCVCIEKLLCHSVHSFRVCCICLFVCLFWRGSWFLFWVQKTEWEYCVLVHPNVLCVFFVLLNRKMHRQTPLSGDTHPHFNTQRIIYHLAEMFNFISTTQWIFNRILKSKSTQPHIVELSSFFYFHSSSLMLQCLWLTLPHTLLYCGFTLWFFFKKKVK